MSTFSKIQYLNNFSWFYKILDVETINFRIAYLSIEGRCCAVMQYGSEYVISEGFTDSVTEDDLKHIITQYH